MSRFRPGGVWRHPAFVRLWGASVVSGLGSAVTALALPLVAAFTLGASPFQMGLLAAAGTAPVLALGLAAGVWVDRRAKRPVMIVTDVGRAVLLLLIPAVAWLGLLRFELLLLVAVLVGVLSVFFDVAAQSFLPVILRNEDLSEGNARLFTGYGIAEVGGPGLAGGLTQLVSAPAAVLIDAVSYVFSALFLGGIQAVEPTRGPLAGEPKPHFWRELMEGLRIVAGTPILRATAAATGLWNLFENALNAMLVIFMARTLGLSAAAIGIVFTVAAAGYLVGSLFPERVARRVGLGRAIVLGIVGSLPGQILVATATGPPDVAAGMVAAGMIFSGIASPIYDVNQFSLRQAVTPLRLQGRVNATMRTLIRGAVPLGALLGGVLAEPLGLRGVIWFGLLGAPVALLAIWFSPVRSLVAPPARMEE